MTHILFSRSNHPTRVVAGLATCAALLAAPVAWATNQIKLQVDPRTAEVKQKITLTATVTTDGQSATGGTVTFLDGKTSLGSIQVVGTHPAFSSRTCLSRPVAGHTWAGGHRSARGAQSAC